MNFSVWCGVVSCGVGVGVRGGVFLGRLRGCRGRDDAAGALDFRSEAAADERSDAPPAPGAASDHA